MSPVAISKAAAITFAALALSSSACVRISSTTLAEPVGMYNPDSVKVFAVNHPAQYTEIAMLRSHRFLVSDTRVLDALKRSAAQVGANGILLINAANSATQSHSGTGVIVTGRNAGNVVVADGETRVDAFERAIAIRFSPMLSEAR